MKALIVDDSRVARLHISRIVRSIGLETVEARHGQQALQILRDDAEIDVAFLDVNMPIMNGVECLLRLREELPLHRVKVMIVSMEAEFSVIRDLLGKGADEFLMKPPTFEAVRDKLGLLWTEDLWEKNSDEC